MEEDCFGHYISGLVSTLQGVSSSYLQYLLLLVVIAVLTS